MFYLGWINRSVKLSFLCNREPLKKQEGMLAGCDNCDINKAGKRTGKGFPAQSAFTLDGNNTQTDVCHQSYQFGDNPAVFG